MPSFFIKMCHITNFWHPLHSSVWPHHQLSAPAMAPCHKKISGRKGKGSILTHHVCPVCSKDFVSVQGLAGHLTSVPYCHQSWLIVSNGLPIDHIVLPTNAPSFCPDPDNHSLDDADDDYHPIYATSIDGQDDLASDNDDLCKPMMIWKKILVLTHTQNSPQMSMKAMLLVTPPPTSPTQYFLLLNLLHPARTTMVSSFCPLSHSPRMWRIFVS